MARPSPSNSAAPGGAHATSGGRSLRRRLPRWERGPAPWWLRLLLPLLAIVITFLIASLLIAASGANPLEVFREMLLTPFTRRTSRLEILVRLTPLLLTGTAVAI